MAIINLCLYVALSFCLCMHIIAGRLCFSYRSKSQYFLGFAATFVGCACASMSAAYRVQAPHLACVIMATSCLVYSLVLFISAIWTTRRRKLTAALSGDAPEVLLESGPWAYVRHPLYAAYLSCFYGLAWLSCAPLAIVSALLMNLIFVRIAADEEKKFARSALKDAYAAYRARCGAFLVTCMFHRTCLPRK